MKELNDNTLENTYRSPLLEQLRHLHAGQILSPLIFLATNVISLHIVV